jgi:RimJ/RimL family protein N-acetyltransferase
MKLFYKCLPQKTYKSEEYVYEAVQHEDIESIRQWRNEQMDVLRQTHAIGREEQIEYFKNNVWPEMGKDQPDKILLSIKSNGKLIGYGGLVNISWTNLRGELSFLIDSNRINNRNIYHKDMEYFIIMIKDLSFKTLSLNRLFTETFSFRKDQISILEDFGMDIEGVLKSSYKINGKYCDSVIQSVINK